MPRQLDAKTIRLSDDTELEIRFTWQAMRRFQLATGVDLFADDEGGKQRSAKAVNENLGVLIHSLLTSKELRQKYTAEDIGELIDITDVIQVVDQVFAALRKREDQQNVPFVNGLAGGSDSTLKLPTLSGDSISA